MKLNLGCGNKKIKGWINCDKSDIVKPDKVIDLEKKLPFKDNSVEKIICEHVLEHIHNFIPLMKELHRVCKPNAKIYIKTPFYASWGQYNDPTHVRFFTPYTFNYFNKGNYSHETETDNNLFNIKFKLNFGIGISSIFNLFINPYVNLFPEIYCRFFAWLLPCSEIRYILQVKK